jgi:hypothetical protein
MTPAQISCTGLDASAPSQILLAGNGAATTASFNLWNAAPHGIVIPSPAVSNPNVPFAIEIMASPGTTFTGSPTDGLFQLSLTAASAVSSGTYYVGYCQENAAQNGCVSGSTIADQTVFVSGTAVGTNGLNSGTISIGSTPYLIEIYSASTGSLSTHRAATR